MIYAARRQKEGPPKRAFLLTDAYATERMRSGGLAVDLGEIVLGGLGAIGNQLAEIFARDLGPRHEQFAARAQHVGLDLYRLVERFGGSELVDAGEERLGVLVERLLDVAADLGGFGNRTGNGGLDRVGCLLGTRVEIGGALLGGAGGLLHELARCLGDFHVLEVLERVGDGREGVLDGVQHGIGFGGHGVSPSSDLSYGLTPSGWPGATSI